MTIEFQAEGILAQLFQEVTITRCSFRADDGNPPRQDGEGEFALHVDDTFFLALCEYLQTTPCQLTEGVGWVDVEDVEAEAIKLVH